MVWMIKSCKESTVEAFWSQEYSRVRFHCSQNLADPGFMCNKSWSCIPLPSLTIWLYLTHLFHQPASSKGHHLLRSLHGPPWTSSSASAVPDAKAAESELPHSSPGSSACCIRALGMHGPKHHSNYSNGMQWREHPKNHQSFNLHGSHLETLNYTTSSLAASFSQAKNSENIPWGMRPWKMSLRIWAKIQWKKTCSLDLSCLLVKSIFNSTSESSSASNSHWTGHLDIKTLLGLLARWYQAPRECQRHVYTWKSAWYWKRKDSTTPVQNYEEN